jgi:seryl-tRNA(Sec) selenium transferase
VLGRIAQQRLWLDCRCLEADDEAELLRQFADCPLPNGER